MHKMYIIFVSGLRTSFYIHDMFKDPPIYAIFT